MEHPYKQYHPRGLFMTAFKHKCSTYGATIYINIHK